MQCNKGTQVQREDERAMPTDRELMQMALDGLNDSEASDARYEAIQALRDRLAQPERQWVGLTDEDVREAFNTAYDGEDYGLIGDFSWFAELIEAKLKEKNT
jgi:hypothetical protein